MMHDANKSYDRALIIMRSAPKNASGRFAYAAWL